MTTPAKTTDARGASPSTAGLGALVVKTKGGGILAIRKDAVMTVEASNYGGRNLNCSINGIATEAGYDFVIDALGWKLHECV